MIQNKTLPLPLYLPLNLRLNRFSGETSDSGQHKLTSGGVTVDLFFFLNNSILFFRNK